MAFKFSLKEVPLSSNVVPAEILDTACALHDSIVDWCNLCGENEELLQCQENCMHALAAIEADPKAVDVLNVDDSLSKVLNLERPSVQQVITGLEGLLSTAWEKIKAFFKKIWDWIKSFLGISSKKVVDNAKKSNDLKAKVAKVIPAELEKLLDEPMPGLLTKKCVDEMHSQIGYLTGSKGPIGKFVDCFTESIKLAEGLVKKHKDGVLKDIDSDEDFDAMSSKVWDASRPSNGLGDGSILRPFGMSYNYSVSDGFSLVMRSDDFLEKCETLRAGGWTDPEAYVDRCAVICNSAEAAYRVYMKNQSTIDADIRKCTTLCDTLSKSVRGTFNSSMINTLMRHSKELGIIVTRLRQVNDACYCAALDARVMRILNKTVQEQHRITE